ncbi:sugar ABC transporter permease [Streptomyces sp. WAC 00631]|uniref:carbohydrate ABC transporter permease n=1 Tax=unclassified Streptomyces TaxID=2593676 RepID=UPI000F7B08FB|nr:MULTISPECIES: sugar ABC transporter permease [unclassified Streptomyces]MCC5033126.1 sugar ABC transporter permease [Streptomyces sp. WAC 00631]MCC9741208.1 sugar ABC transporter permease [Streptomyces sp. MNU89]
MTTATAGGAATPGAPPPVTKKGVAGTRAWIAACFLLPALVLLAALVVYPIGYSVVRSFFDTEGTAFVGLDNYGELFSDPGTRTALKNNLVWVIVAPAVSTALGLIYAVLTERVRWGTAFKMIVFMPMAISMLAAGIIFTLVYQQDPERGVANAVWTGIHDTFSESSAYPGARPRPNTGIEKTAGGSFTTEETVRAGDPAGLPLVGIPPAEIPKDAAEAVAAEPDGDKVTGTVWLDFTPGGGGEAGVIDRGEKALAGVKVEAVRDGEVVASAESGEDGRYSLPASAAGAQLRLPGSNFTEAYNGINWLGPNLVTPAIIGSYIWMWAGFAMVLIGAGLASVPRELMEAARVDGANEWQVFRKVTVPLLAPVLAVVTVTLMINVLKIFDLVYILAPGATQNDANVLALQLYLLSFGTDAEQGVGSAIAVVLLLLVVPVMAFNIRRMRRERRP